MTAANDTLIAQLRRDPLRHITPLKMYALYSESMRVLPVPTAHDDDHAGALVLVAPTAVSQYDSLNYGDVEWVVMPALPLHADAALVAACAATILNATQGLPFVLKTIDAALVAALTANAGRSPPPQYRRALCTFGAPGRPGTPGAPSAGVLKTAHVTDPARALLRLHGVYSDAELDNLFADGSARCHVRGDPAQPGAGGAIGVLLTFPNTPEIHEIGSLHVRADARRAGHARALLGSALADLHARQLKIRYVVDATNTASIALAEAAGLQLQLRLEHWVFA